MRFKQEVLIPTNGLLQSIHNIQRQQVNCSNIVEVLDKCGANSSYSHTIISSNYPTSLAELKESCPKVHNGLTCLRKHLKCLHPLTRRAIMLFIESRRKHHRLICSNLRSQESKNFVDTYKCVNTYRHQRSKEHEVHTIRQIDAILSNQVTDFKERFRRACCAIFEYRKSSLSDLEPECASATATNVVETMIESVVGQALEFACPDPKSGVCNSLTPLNLGIQPINKSLTRAGTDLMLVITAPEENDKRDKKAKNKTLHST